MVTFIWIINRFDIMVRNCRNIATDYTKTFINIIKIVIMFMVKMIRTTTQYRHGSKC